MTDIPFDNFTQKGAPPVMNDVEEYIRKNALPR
jgi:hypothetical protein